MRLTTTWSQVEACRFVCAAGSGSGALPVGDEHLVDRAAQHMMTLQLPVVLTSAPDALGVKHAPAFAPDAVVRLAERGEFVQVCGVSIRVVIPMPQCRIAGWT
jgi:hypothetical protein